MISRQGLLKKNNGSIIFCTLNQRLWCFMKIIRLLMLTFITLFLSGLFFGNPVEDCRLLTENYLRRSSNQMGGRTLLHTSTTQQTACENEEQKKEKFQRVSPGCRTVLYLARLAVSRIHYSAEYKPLSLLIWGMSFRL